MANNFSEPVGKIVDNYFKRLKRLLKGLPENDQEELVKEIHSHIYESFRNDPTENEVERILNVLDKLGEPADVISSRIPPAMMKMGTKKKLPLYILAGITIALFGIPLGLGGISLLLAFFLTILAFIATYYLMALSLIICGWVGMVLSILMIINPHIVDSLKPYVQMSPITPDPTLNAIISLAASVVIIAFGIVLLWLGKYMMRGIRFLFHVTFEKIRESKKRRKLRTQYA